MIEDINEGLRRDAATFAKQFVLVDERWIFRRFNGSAAIVVTEEERDRAIRRERVTNVVVSILGAATMIAAAVGSEMADTNVAASQSVFFAGFIVATLTLIFGRMAYLNLAVRGERLAKEEVARLSGGWASDLVAWSRSLTYASLVRALLLCILLGLGLSAQALPLVFDVGGMVFAFAAAMCWLLAAYMAAMLMLKFLH